MQQTRFNLFGQAHMGLSFFALGVLFFVPVLRAGDPGQATRAVRLGSVDGQVTLAENGQVVANPALVNTPVFEGSQITTASDGRAELQFDDGSVVRISPDGALSLPLLRPSGEAQLQLDHGLAYFELQGSASSAPVSVHFGDATVTVSGFTVLRLRFDTPPGELAVFSGNAHLERPGGLSLNLHGGQSVRLDPANPARYTLSEAIEPDSWDTWNSDRDEALTSAASERTGAVADVPNSNAPAWNDLDNYGNWYNLPGRGNIWAPYEGSTAGWDPWGNGHWLWTPRFSYIWVSGDPWGYMPFACGVWDYYDSFGWGWMPGNCNPWWGGGAWVSTYYGGGYDGGGPRGFRFPHRPRIGPPGGHGFLPGGGGNRPLQPILTINRRPASGAVPGEFRQHGVPVTIGGVMVQPMRPLPQRPQYDHTTGGAVRAQSPAWGSYRTPSMGGNAGAVHSSSPQQGFQQGGSRSTYPSLPQRTVTPTLRGTPSNGAGGGTRPAYGGNPHPAPGGGFRVSPSSGGGGSHPSSGGGGGSHPSASSPHK
jgi:hypothetical protein